MSLEMFNALRRGFAITVDDGSGESLHLVFFNPEDEDRAVAFVRQLCETARQAEFSGWLPEHLLVPFTDQGKGKQS